MEKISKFKFNTLEKNDMKSIRGGDGDPCNSSMHCAEYLPNSCPGGDTSHTISTDAGNTTGSYSTKGNTVGQGSL